MKLYRIVLKPLGLFATPLVGDTLFGQLCWQFVDDPVLLKADFEEVLSSYRKSPFCIVSSAFPELRRQGSSGFAIPRPDLALFGRLETENRETRRKFLKERKELKKQKWFFVDEKRPLRFDNTLLMGDAELTASLFQGMDAEDRKRAACCTGDFLTKGEEMHNSINRLTGTTAEGFAPFSTPSFSVMPGVRFLLFVLLDETVCSPDALQIALERIGTFGYGRDASSGRGRFSISAAEECAVPAADGCNALCTLAPCVPVMEEVERGWFTPLTRFGKHGGGAQLSGNPFKSPVIMAETGAVFKTDPHRLWLGQGISGVSNAIEQTVVQGYAPCIPCTVEV